MSQYYNAKRTRNLYSPGNPEPFRISRSKIENFLKCPRCFYFDRRLGVEQPGGFPFSLNNAVDELLKNEFDYYRAKAQIHPIVQKNGINAKPFIHEQLNDWRDSRHKGIQYLHPSTNLLITGGVDDIWENENGELIVVDYKATSKKEEVNLDADWQISYKRQMEIYQWLFRKNGFKVSDTGYFVYCNGITDKDFFDSKLEFEISLLPYKGNDSWIDKTIFDIHNCLNSNQPPDCNKDCDFCAYRRALKDIDQ